MSQNYDFQSSGWPAAAPAMGVEQVFGVDASGALAAMPLGLLRSPGAAHLDAARLPKFSRAKARVMSGVAKGRIMLLGDSTTAAYGAAAGMANCRALAPAARLARRMAGAGIPAVGSNFLSDGGASTVNYAINTYDPRVTLTGAWHILNAAGGGGFGQNPYWCLGGYVLQTSGVASGAVTFAPTEAVDTFEVYYCEASGSGPFTASIDGGAPSSPVATSISSGTGIGKATFSCGSPGQHTIAITPTSTAFLAIEGIVGFNSQAPAFDVLNAGYAGITASSYVAPTTGYAPMAELALIAPDLTIIDLGINDWRFGNPTAPFTTAMQTIINAAQQSGDVILAVPVPSDVTYASNQQPGFYNVMTQSEIAAYQQAIYALAAANTNPGSVLPGLPVIDFAYLNGSGASRTALGMMNDQLHPNALGYQDKAEKLFSFLSKV